MGNCVITKLKESVNNPALLKLDEVLFSNLLSGKFSVKAENLTVRATVVGDGYFDIDGTHVSYYDFITSSPDIDFVSNGASIKCNHKEAIYYIKCTGLNFRDVEYLTSYEYGSIPQSYGDIGYFSNTSVYKLQIGGENVYGDLNHLPSNMQQVWVRDSQATATDIGAFVASTKDRSNVDIEVDGSPNITGSIEDIVSKCVDAARINKVLTLVIKNTGITFGGSEDAANTAILGDSILRWTDKTHITFQGGSDANVADSSKNVHIFAKGATAEQISAWESQGNTVHVIS